MGKRADKKNNEKVTVDVLGIKDINGKYYYKVFYKNTISYVMLFKFEVDRINYYRTSTRRLQCIYKGTDENGKHKLVQDRNPIIDKYYKKGDVISCKYISTNKDSNGYVYHILSDDRGLKHRHYGRLEESQMRQNTNIEMYISDINQTKKTLMLITYDDYKKSLAVSKGTTIQKKDVEIGSIGKKVDYINDTKTTYDIIHLCINADSFLVISENDLKRFPPDTILRFVISSACCEGYLLFVDSIGSIIKISLKGLFSLPKDEKIPSHLNPFEVSNYFVIYENCVLGMVITTNYDRYVALFSTENIKESSINNIIPFRHNMENVVDVQPFILPAQLPNMFEIGKVQSCTEQQSLYKNKDAINYLASFGVII